MKNIIPTIKYIKLTLKHKYFVFRAGLKFRVPIFNLIIHDWSKFTPSEAPHYGRQFFGDKNDDLGFARAWNHHQNYNPHHWEYWVMVNGHERGGFNAGDPIPMPEKYVREMVADWFGAARAYEGRWPVNLEEWDWFQFNFHKINVHKSTRFFIRRLLDDYFSKLSK